MCCRYFHFCSLAHDLEGKGRDVVAIVDSRPLDAIGEEKEGLNAPIYPMHQLFSAHGRKHVNSVEIRSKNGVKKNLKCDIIAVSGGWNPTVHLYSQSRGTLAYDDELASFIPDKPAQKVFCIGAAAGKMNIGSAMAETVKVVSRCLGEYGFLDSSITTTFVE